MVRQGCVWFFLPLQKNEFWQCNMYWKYFQINTFSQLLNWLWMSWFVMKFTQHIIYNTACDLRAQTGPLLVYSGLLGLYDYCPTISDAGPFLRSNFPSPSHTAHRAHSPNPGAELINCRVGLKHLQYCSRVMDQNLSALPVLRSRCHHVSVQSSTFTGAFMEVLME